MTGPYPQSSGPNPSATAHAIAARADLDAREATIALGMISQIEWALRR